MKRSFFGALPLLGLLVTLAIPTLTFGQAVEEEQKTYQDFFPDPNLAQAVAESLMENKEDYVTQEELSYAGPDLTYKRIKSIEGVEYLTSIYDLNVEGNEIQVLPDSLGTDMPSLQGLYAADNNIQKIPDSLAQSPYLYHMNLDNNQIEVLPDSLGNVDRWKELSLKNNRIQTIPDSLWNAEVNSLSLDGNLIKEVGDGPGNEEALYYLTLSHNQISEIPENISDNVQLQTLDLSYNHIDEWITKMPPNLYNLNLSYNRISNYLPEYLLPYVGMSRWDGTLYSPLYGQDIVMDHLALDPDDAITAQMLLPPLIPQISALTGVGLPTYTLAGHWEIINPQGEQTNIAGRDGSEITKELFSQPGTYHVRFIGDADRYYNNCWIRDINSYIQVYVREEPEPSPCEVAVKIIYQDDSRPDQETIYTVPYGEAFQGSFDVPASYAIKKVSFNTMGITVNRTQKKIIIDAVTHDVAINITVG